MLKMPQIVLIKVMVVIDNEALLCSPRHSGNYTKIKPSNQPAITERHCNSE